MSSTATVYLRERPSHGAYGEGASRRVYKDAADVRAVEGTLRIEHGSSVDTIPLWNVRLVEVETA